MININELQKYRLPQHIAIIMDGNGRWAKRQEKKRVFGHHEGVKTVKNIVDPSIVGGYILRVGDQQLDSSVTGLLNSVLEGFGDNQYISKLN